MMLLCGEIDNKMRKGGSMRLKKVHSTFLTAALACSLAVTPVFANPAEDAENLKNQKTEAESELSNLQTQFDTLIQKANELELKLIKTGEAIIQAQADLEAAEEKNEKHLSETCTVIDANQKNAGFSSYFTIHYRINNNKSPAFFQHFLIFL